MYALPFSYCGLTEIAIVEKDASAAQSYLKKVKGISSSYEFETFLQWRVRKCEDDIRSMKQLNLTSFIVFWKGVVIPQCECK